MATMRLPKAGSSLRGNFERRSGASRAHRLDLFRREVRLPSGDRTAPYWRDIMVIDIYVAMADGVWTHEPKAHALLPYLVGTSERRLVFRTLWELHP